TLAGYLPEDVGILPTIETARGILRTEEIAAGGQRVLAGGVWAGEVAPGLWGGGTPRGAARRVCPDKRGVGERCHRGAAGVVAVGGRRTVFAAARLAWAAGSQFIRTSWPRSPGCFPPASRSWTGPDEPEPYSKKRKRTAGARFRWTDR